MYLCLIQADEKILLRSNNEGSIMSFHTEQEGLDVYESMYQEYHGRDSTWSTSATINWMSFRPSIVRIPGDTQEDQHKFVIANLIGDNPDGKCRNVIVSNISGRVRGVLCESPKVKEIFEAGAKPRLIH